MKKKPYQRNKKKLEERVSQPSVKNVVAPQPVIRPPRFSRGRLFAIGAGLAAIIGGGYVVSSHPSPAQLIVNGVYDAAEVTRLMKYINNFRPSILSDKEVEEFFASLTQMGIARKDIKIEDMSERDWVIPYEDPEEFELTDAECHKNIDDLFSFVGDQRIQKPRTRIEVPTASGRINERSIDGVFTIYVVKANGTEYSIKYSLPPSVGQVQGPSIKIRPFAGSTGTLFTYHVNDQLVVDNVDYDPRNIIVSVFGLHPEAKFMGMALECLHRAFAQFTKENIRRHIEKYNAQGGRDNTTIRLIIDSNAKFEEALVHAIDISYLESNLGKLPWVSKEVIDRNLARYAADPRYDSMPFVLERIKKEGITAVIDEYCNGGIKFNMKKN